MLSLKQYSRLSLSLKLAVSISLPLSSIFERGLSAPSIEVVEKMAKMLDVSIDELVFGAISERMEKNISDRELLSMFQKVQTLEQQQQNTVKDFISAYLLKADLQKNLVGVK